jgi:hypothetical protein
VTRPADPAADTGLNLLQKAETIRPTFGGRGTSRGMDSRLTTILRRRDASADGGRRFSYGAVPASLAVTEGILVSFFSSA